MAKIQGRERIERAFFGRLAMVAESHNPMEKNKNELARIVVVYVGKLTETKNWPIIFFPKLKWHST